MQTDAEDTFAEDTENNADETDDDDPTETMTPARRAQAEARWEELNRDTHPGLDGSEEEVPVLRRRNAGVVLPNLAHIERDRKIKKKPHGLRSGLTISPVRRTNAAMAPSTAERNVGLAVGSSGGPGSMNTSRFTVPPRRRSTRESQRIFPVPLEKPTRSNDESTASRTSA